MSKSPRRITLSLLLEARVVVDLSFQACSNVTRVDVAVLDECCPAGRDSSLNLFSKFLYLGFCLWCCIVIPGRRSVQHSISE